MTLELTVKMLDGTVKVETERIQGLTLKVAERYAVNRAYQRVSIDPDARDCRWAIR